MWRRGFAIVLLLGGCGGERLVAKTPLRQPVKVNVTQDRSAEFRQLRTWSWLPDIKLDVVDPRIDVPLLERHLREAIAAALEAKSFEHKQSGKADFLVAFDAALAQKLDLGRRRYAYSPGEAWGLDTPTAGQTTGRVVESFDQGTLIIDVVQPEGMKLIWRGTGQTRLELDKDSQRARIERIHRTARAILDKFPPKRRAAAPDPE